MNDIYSPSQASNGENNMEFQPIPLPGASGDDVPELNFNIPGLDDPSSVNHLSPDFYGSYGEEFKSADPTPMPDFSVPEINLPDSSASSFLSVGSLCKKFTSLCLLLYFSLRVTL